MRCAGRRATPAPAAAIANLCCCRLPYTPHQVRACRAHCAHLAVHLHQPLHEDAGHLLAGQRVLQAVAQQQDERQALARLVRAGAGLGRLRSGGGGRATQHASAGRRNSAS